jgi:mannose-6-phosphate isomerase
VKSLLYPFTFQPRFKDRVWGGRHLARLYDKPLPAGQPIGESWEITDRPGDISVITNGPLAGKDLHWLVENHRAELLGDAKLQGDRFPLLIKLLDAREKLSLQVHPPADKATELGGEPKTEMWFIADAEPGAELYVGLKRGVKRAEFESRIQDGSVAECFHRVPVKAGDAMFLPSGRVHAIGAGLVIFEIQQNSDTTYRVFDWNRVGLDGKPRELHVQQSLASIDFNDFEPPLVQSKPGQVLDLTVRQLVTNELFTVELVETPGAAAINKLDAGMEIIGLVAGRAEVVSSAPIPPIELTAGQFCLLPAAVASATLSTAAGSRLLRIRAG